MLMCLNAAKFLLKDVDVVNSSRMLSSKPKSDEFAQIVYSRFLGATYRKFECGVSYMELLEGMIITTCNCLIGT